MSSTAVSGERFPTKLAAVFGSQQDADAAIRRLVTDAEVPRDQIDLVKPDDPGLEKKLEPESRGIARTGLLAHAKLGLTGLLIGAVLGLGLIVVGVDMAESSPVMIMVAFVFFGTIAGLLLGGLVTARPDHSKAILDARSASRHGKWTVVVHTADSGQHKRAHDVLAVQSQDITETM